MYDELIEQMRSRASWLEFAIIATPSKTDGNRDAILFRKAADAIEELQKQLREEKVDNVNLTGWLAEEHAKHLWIPVTERLPDHYETVLLYIESEPEGYITIGSYDYREMRWKDFCDVNREVYQADVVTHWMPLPPSPEPPKEES